MPEYCYRLDALFDRMEIDVDASGSSYSLGSKVYARILERLCGGESDSKHLPAFIGEVHTDLQERLLEVLLAGDGNDWDVFCT